MSEAASASLRRRVLVVDDDVQYCELLDAWLGRSYELDVAHDGEEGVTHARRERPDVILLDVMMPKLSGFSLAWVFKHDPFFQDVPVVYCTAHSQEMGNGPESLARADAYLLKPFRLADLQATIQRLLAGSPAPLEALDAGGQLPQPATIWIDGQPRECPDVRVTLWGLAAGCDAELPPGTACRVGITSVGPLSELRARVVGRTPAGRVGLRILFDGQVDRLYMEHVGRIGRPGPPADAV
jgi:CheY-like chemotaxis protein